MKKFFAKGVKHRAANIATVVVAAVLIASVAAAANVNNIVGSFSSPRPYQTTPPTLGDGVYSSDLGEISFQSEKDFKVLAVTDMHINGTNSRDKFISILENLVKAHKPDLVVFTGDNLDTWDQASMLGYNSNFNNKSSANYQKLALDGSVAAKFKELYQLYGTKWCGLMGNHDRDPGGNGTKNQNDFLKRLADDGSYGCLYSEGVTYKTGSDGYYDQKGAGDVWYHKYGDYIINVKDGDEVVYSLAFVDSGQHESPGNEKNGYISAEQVEWYKSSMKAIAEAKFGEFSLEKGYFVPSMIFFHQPTPEFVFAAQLAAPNAGGTGWINPELGFGYNGESPTARIQREDVNYGLFQAMKEVGGTDISVGHNHDNNSTILYDGIRLSYNNRTGRRDTEGGAWPDSRISYAKMYVIKQESHEVDVVFARPGAEDSGITTKQLVQADVQR